MTTDTKTNRVAIVTGGSGGIGRQTAERLAADGMAVVVCYAGNPGPAKDAVAAIEDGGGTAMAAQADVADEAAVAALFDAAEQAYGGVDVVVHTAGVMLLSPLADLNLADFDTMHRINVRGLLVVGQQAARRLRRGGALINFSSSVVKIALTG
jgi:3-oxoacyl-[acyl-carrier protein] reductase